MKVANPALLQDAVNTAKLLRQDLHQHPELMYQEHRTAQRVSEHLTEFGIEHRAGLAGGTGVLGYLPATTKSPDQAQTVALRADMDALPILEDTGVPYSSQTPGVMHACGHDGHTAILVGTAKLLKAQERDRNVLFVFQPAEEGGAGGRRMCEDGVLNGSVLGPKADVMFGLHCAPMVELGSLSSRVGPMMASTDEFTIIVQGKGGHAASPHVTNDPIVVAAHIVTALQTIASRGVDPLESVVVTVGKIEAGAVSNVIPTTVMMLGTIRTLKADVREFAVRRVREIAEQIASAFGATAEMRHKVGYPVTVNDPTAHARVESVATDLVGENWGEYPPVMGGEDFSFYGEHVPACFYWLGIAPQGQEYAQVHTPFFDFNDDALPIGIEMMSQLALRG
jgi:amidohydrolase